MKVNVGSATSLIVAEGGKSLDTDSSEAFERLDLQVRTLEAMARETFQYQFRHDYEAVVKKLQDGKNLSPADRELLAQLVIADAKSYVQHEKEYEGWKDQIAGMLSELNAIQKQGVHSKEDLLHIQSICRELRAVLPGITHYLRERERIQSYERNDIQSLSPDLKKMLAEIIQLMMTSDKA